MTIGATADTRPMRVRVLVLGLAFFGFAVALAVQPHVASGHSPKLQKPCTVKGTSGADLLQGTSGPDVICGYGGNDTIGASSGNDIVCDGPGNDRIQGDGGADVLQGGSGSDSIWARDGRHDHVNGGRGFDRYRYDQSIDRKVNVEAKM
ncbi:MAG: calcium-binding protein [Gaiellaceae bacterium]